MTTPAVADPAAPAAPATPPVDPTPAAPAAPVAGKEPAPAAAAPETYQPFTVPAGMELDATLMESAAPVFRELGLNQAQAQKLADLYAGQLGAMVAAEKGALDARDVEWTTAAKADPEIGGAQYEANLAAAARAVEMFGGPEQGKALKEALNATRLGNHPELIKTFVRMGKLIAEGKFVTGGGTPTNAGPMTLGAALGFADHKTT